MKNIFTRKNNKAIIDNLLHDVRNGYNQLIENYNKPSSLREQFNQRYREAIKSRMQLEKFLKTEKEVVETLIGQAKAKVEAELSGNKDDKKEREKNFADKVLEGFEDKIKKYPSIFIHPNASKEIKKLFGAIAVFEKDHWQNIEGILRRIEGQKHYNLLLQLDSNLRRMVSNARDSIPSALITYNNYLSQTPQKLHLVDEEEKRCLVDVAVMLKKMQREIIKTLDQALNMEKDERIKLKEALSYVEGLLEDFRIEDLGRLGLSVRS